MSYSAQDIYKILTRPWELTSLYMAMTLVTFGPESGYDLWRYCTHQPLVQSRGDSFQQVKI